AATGQKQCRGRHDHQTANQATHFRLHGTPFVRVLIYCWGWANPVESKIGAKRDRSKPGFLRRLVSDARSQQIVRHASSDSVAAPFIRARPSGRFTVRSFLVRRFSAISPSVPRGSDVNVAPRPLSGDHAERTMPTVPNQMDA